MQRSEQGPATVQVVVRMTPEDITHLDTYVAQVQAHLGRGVRLSRAEGVRRLVRLALDSLAPHVPASPPPALRMPMSRPQPRTDVEQRRRVIVGLLHQHQGGLTGREIREATGASRSLTDSALSGLFTRGIIHKRGHRYMLAAQEEGMAAPCIS